VVDVQELRPEQRPRHTPLLRLRSVAGLNGVALVARPAAIALVALVVLLAVAAPVGAEPKPDETPRPPTCAERYPAEGPAGVDLRLGCIVSEVVGLYRPGQAGPPPTLSTYAVWLGILLVAGIGLALVVLRALGRGAGRRLAPTTPDAWWVCATCHSINGTATSRCYNCAAPRPDDPGALLPTSDDPATPQSFGRGKHA
jgi:hypothetical protein